MIKEYEQLYQYSNCRHLVYFHVFFFSPLYALKIYFSSVQFSRSVVSDSLQPHESQNMRPPCPSPTVSHAIQPSHPLLSPSPPVPNPSQYQSFPMSQRIVIIIWVAWKLNTKWQACQIE